MISVTHQMHKSWCTNWSWGQWRSGHGTPLCLVYITNWHILQGCWGFMTDCPYSWLMAVSCPGIFLSYPQKILSKYTRAVRRDTDLKDISQLVPSFTINDSEMERINNFNFLGITLDENVTWKPNIGILSNKVSKYSGILNRLKHNLPLHIMRMLYCSLVNSHLLYGILVWGYECHRLEKIQKRIIRIITVSTYDALTEPLFKVRDHLKLKDMLNLSTLKFYYRYLHDNLPAYFYSFQITTQGSHHHYNTRHSDQIHVDRTTRLYADKRVWIYLPKMVKSIPKPLVQKIATHSLQGFSANITKYFIIRHMLHSKLLYLS